MSDVEVLVEVPVYPTEDPEKVRRAVENVLPGAEYELKPAELGHVLVARASGRDALLKLRALVRMERISDAARAVLLSGLEGNTIVFYLNKQVAYVRHISFSEPEGESPLGPMKFVVKCDDARALIDWLAPRTA
ncbi:MAG TPA: hypothetical protein ENG43_00665 [Candidatus Bathyarchaeota archaeon]|nr:MAG: hypothetical protein DRO60_00095 [Candidatus Bathyarchaeota archaeon]HDO81727.1 hypothetical protein [Candidatus Bathyarchaeota archaeon]HEW89839.1 hypothetical protein [Candidatus Bathyarchaeota archaeon]